ncbi:MAG: hypothetical protein GF388_08055, partial [Candidatus Aegiribacteria sp.]|nr:hypothetical protein [Candidatus Aegiribacteria sp.]MBD3295046.1 hypothetical protein [Candidatus Fermentibacteria bacterium]
MGEEQKEILQMVSDGKISADEGAKLLEALERGKKKRSRKTPAGRARTRKRIARENIQGGDLDGLTGLGSIGKMIRGIVKNSISGMSEDEEFSNLDENLAEPMEITDEPISIPDGTHLVVKRNPSRGGSGNISIERNDTDQLLLQSTSPDSLKLYQDENMTVVKAGRGNLQLTVPDSVDELTISNLGGNIQLSGLPARINIKSKGGNVTLESILGDLLCKSMGGCVSLSLSSEWNGESIVSAMGGNILLELDAETDAIISAK